MATRKACPFCDGVTGQLRNNGQWWCDTCGAEGPDMRANYTWDSRPREDELDNQLRDLENMRAFEEAGR